MTDRQRPAHAQEYPAFALPPFSPAHWPKPPEAPPPARVRTRTRRRARPDGAFWSGVLTALSVVALVVAVVALFRTHA